jgi:hypothetical protein
MKTLFYKLKQKYGVVLDFYQMIPGTIDRETGDLDSSRTKTTIQKAVLIPLTLQYSSINRSDFRIGDREALIAKLDMPVPGENDYFVYNQKRFDIVSVTDIDPAVYYFHLRQTQSRVPYQVVDTVINENLALGDTSERELG